MREGDSFKWIPRKDRIAREEDIITHPRRISAKDLEWAKNIYGHVENNL